MSAKAKRKPNQCQCEDPTCPCGGSCSVRIVKRVKFRDTSWLACLGCRRHRLIDMPKRKPRKVRRVVMGWQPIETAPHMRKLLVFYVNACGMDRTVMACYFDSKTLEMDDDCGVDGEWDEATLTDYAPAGWYEQHEHDSPLMPLEEQPTHWMPLPDPPKAKR